jgi:hypothetical protein
VEKVMSILVDELWLSIDVHRLLSIGRIARNARATVPAPRPARGA